MRDSGTPSPGRRRRPCRVGRADRAPPRPPAPHGRPAARPPPGAASTRRTSSRRRRSSRSATCRTTSATRPAVLPLAPLPDRPGPQPSSTAPSGCPGARRRPRGPHLRRAHARGHLGGAGRPLLGQRHPPQRRRRQGRAEAPAPGGARRPRPDRPRGPGPAALRGALQRGDGPRLGIERVGRRQAVPPRPEASEEI